MKHRRDTIEKSRLGNSLEQMILLHEQQQQKNATEEKRDGVRNLQTKRT